MSTAEALAFLKSLDYDAFQVHGDVTSRIAKALAVRLIRSCELQGGPVVFQSICDDGIEFTVIITDSRSAFVSGGKGY